MRPFTLAALVLAACGVQPTTADDPAPDAMREASDDSPTQADDTDAPDAPTGDTDNGGTVDTDADTDGSSGAPLCAGKTVGTAVGECAPDFTLMDATGTAHSLYDYAGDVIVLDFSTMWCPHCRNLAPALEDLHDDYASQGLTVITVLHENQDSQTPTADDLNTWANAYNITHPLLTDPGGMVEADFGGFYQPNVLLIDRDMEVVWRANGSSAAGDVEDAVLDAL